MKTAIAIISVLPVAAAIALAYLRPPTKATPWILCCIAALIMLQNWRKSK